MGQEIKGIVRPPVKMPDELPGQRSERAVTRIPRKQVPLFITLFVWYCFLRSAAFLVFALIEGLVPGTSPGGASGRPFRPGSRPCSRRSRLLHPGDSLLRCRMALVIARLARPLGCQVHLWSHGSQRRCQPFGGPRRRTLPIWPQAPISVLSSVSFLTCLFAVTWPFNRAWTRYSGDTLVLSPVLGPALSLIDFSHLPAGP